MWHHLPNLQYIFKRKSFYYKVHSIKWYHISPPTQLNKI